MAIAAEAPTEQRVLIVDDEPTVREVVRGYLTRDGYVVDEAADGAAALDLIETFAPDLVLLDVMLPVFSGFDVLRRVRTTSSVPIVLLSARTDETDRVLGLELGADDYVVKPFSPREVAARVRAVLRRSAVGTTPAELTTEADGLRIDRRSRQTFVDGNEISLTAKEFDLLAFLASHPRQVFSRRQLLEHVWDSSIDYQDPATVTVHVRRIRTKVEADTEQPRWITTVFGVGYRFEP